MASVETPLLRKLEKVLAIQFPSPDTVQFDDEDGIIGVITSTSFARMDTVDRQNLIART